MMEIKRHKAHGKTPKIIYQIKKVIKIKINKNIKRGISFQYICFRFLMP